MSDSDEESFCFYGKPLEQYDEDNLPKRKPIPIEDQVATDSHGRRRFHGAFTGGFSAGFFNTVGSLEGWKPTEFKSSRSEKAQAKEKAKPEDFMDDEDMEEHGIAPQIVRATNDYATGKKRKKKGLSEGPIPGVPVLHSLIEAGNETIGYLLLKNMDLRTRSKDPPREPDGEGPRRYGCEMPKTYEIQRNVENEDIIPKIYRDYLKNPKGNTFGLGYIGLDKSELNIKKSTQLVVRDRDNRKLAISGQAFGVGAFENDDEDIYAKDDMSQYDFEMTNEKLKNKTNKNCNHPEFVLGTEKLLNKEEFLPPIIPHSFSGKHKIRKSRFEPMVNEETEAKLERREINAYVRSKYIGEDVPSKAEATKSKPIRKTIEFESQTSTHLTAVQSMETQPNPTHPTTSEQTIKQEPVEDSQPHFFNTDLILGKFVAASSSENPHDILERVEPTYTEHGTQEMRDAAKLNMYGPLTRVVKDWQPCGLLCKRFNVREPGYDDRIKKEPRKKSQILFEYEKHKDALPDLQPGLKVTKQQPINEEPEIPGTDETPNLQIAQEPSTSGDVKRSDESKISNQKNTEERNLSVIITESMEISEGSGIEVNKEYPKKVLDDTDKIDVAKNIDLFKAVFLSSSESESEEETQKEEDEEDKNRKELIKTAALSEDLIPKIRPVKQGILSNIKFNPFVRSTKSEEEKTEKIAEVKVQEDPNLYGPRIPEKLEKKVYDVPRAPQVDDGWVEKDEVEHKKLPRHKKKHKKEKHKKKDKEKKHKHRK